MSDGRRRSRAAGVLRLATVAAAFFLGATFAVGALLAARLESQGFGAPAGQPRGWYLAVLALALVVSVVAPFLVLRIVRPAAGRRAWLAAIASVIVAVVLFGLSLSE